MMLDHIRGGERPSYDSVLPSCQNCTYTGGLLRKHGACRETISRQSIHFLCSCEVGACRLCVALEYKSWGPVGIRLWEDNSEIMLSTECSQHRTF